MLTVAERIERHVRGRPGTLRSNHGPGVHAVPGLFQAYNASTGLNRGFRVGFLRERKLIALFFLLVVRVRVYCWNSAVRVWNAAVCVCAKRGEEGTLRGGKKSQKDAVQWVMTPREGSWSDGMHVILLGGPWCVHYRVSSGFGATAPG